MATALSAPVGVEADGTFRGASEAKPRLAYFDPIRVALTVLVILHHVSIAYGGSGSWYYKEPDAGPLTQAILGIFNCVNQAYFMGFFFLLAGYLMPGSLARKGPLAYLGDRALRLWVPLMLFGYLLNPLTDALAARARGEDFLLCLITKIGHNSFGLGPLWFNQALMVGAFVWVYVSRLSHLQGPANITVSVDALWQPGLHARIALAIVGCGALAFTLRTVVPVGQNVFGVQLGYCASYVILFFGGTWGARYRLLERITWQQAWPWLTVSLTTLPTLWIFGYYRGLMGSTLWHGGWNLAALLYAFWEPMVAAGVIMSVLAVARRWYVKDVAWVKRLAQASYAAFIVHAPTAVACSWLVKDWATLHIQRFLIAGTLSCMLSFAIGIFLTKACARMQANRLENVPAPLVTAAF